MTSSEFDVFISYKREERHLADQVAKALEGAGYSQVTDLNLSNGVHFGDAIDRMIRSARIVLVLWTKSSVSSDWVKNEARLGAELNTYLGVQIEQIQLPVDLKFRQNLNIAGVQRSLALSQIVGAVAEKIGESRTTPQLASTKSNNINDDLRLFETVERLNTVDAYRAYLASFPNGIMSDLAKKRAKSLSTLIYKIKKPIPIVITAVTTISAIAAAFFPAFYSNEADVYFKRIDELRKKDWQIEEIKIKLANALNEIENLKLDQDMKYINEKHFKIITSAATVYAKPSETSRKLGSIGGEITVFGTLEGDWYAINSEKTKFVRVQSPSIIPLR